jgi:hypothetical protein
VTLRARWVTLRARWVTLRARWVTVRARWGEVQVRLMNVLDGDIRTYAEFSIKLCRELRFSTGGQYFAAVSNNVIQLYNTYGLPG